ncbi:uncharacterized protein GGS22DRAFT_194366 [Annulohypoxylon maeteangense]|uniref:uncharacterized protein n=1 Tax=Annulohypoxylon maeteangense TaxID=1927788 RepID=UPI002008A360|nr:uncharacterized protein GGS22DRAFT_194366 [Annulohypoxylon maeteangense]KAI0890192.1 hypothetical protein GGS22DRAFT_194366 [Annulohypoxylon maeteangense]
MAITKDGGIRPLTVIIPLILSIAGFVLAMIAIFAGTGSQQQALEDYHLIAINMSDFGHDLIPTSTSSGSQPSSTSSLWDDLQGAITDQLNDIIGDIADELSKELGISQWYSLHVMTACEGNFAPNATSQGAWYNTTNCTAQSPGVHLNLTALIQKELSAGPLKLNASKLPIPSKIQEAIDYLNSFLLATFTLYALGAGLSGLSFLSSIVALTLSRRSPNPITPAVSAINITLTALATLALALASAIATAIAKKGVQEINDAGDGVGISAVEGSKLMVVSWVAFAVMLAATAFWGLACWVPRRRGRRGLVVVEGEKGSGGRGGGLLGRLRRR